jgi:hypothetical protein
MMDELKSGLPVAGYVPQTGGKIDLVNANKMLEERDLRVIDHLADLPDTDKRMLAIGRTQIQQAWMWINRAIFQSTRIKLPEDG